MKRIIAIGIITMFSCMAFITVGESIKLDTLNQIRSEDNDFGELEIIIKSGNILFMKKRYSLQIINPSSITHYFTYKFKIFTLGLGEVHKFTSAEKTLTQGDSTAIMGIYGRGESGFGFCRATLSISGYGKDEGKFREVTTNGLMLGQIFIF